MNGSPRRKNRGHGSNRLPTFSKGRLALLVAILTFGFTALAAVLGLGNVVPILFVVGFFILVPLIWVLEDEFPLVEPDLDEEGQPRQQEPTNPVRELRKRYVRGEIDEAEFDRRLDRLLETEELEEVYERGSTTGGANRTSRSANRTARDANRADRSRDRARSTSKEFE